MSQNQNFVMSYEDELAALQDRIVKLQCAYPGLTHEQEHELQSLRDELEKMIYENGPGRNQEFADIVKEHLEYEADLDAYYDQVAYEQERDFYDEQYEREAVDPGV